MRCASYWSTFLHRKENIHLKVSVYCRKCRHFVAFNHLHKGWLLIKYFDPLTWWYSPLIILMNGCFFFISFIFFPEISSLHGYGKGGWTLCIKTTSVGFYSINQDSVETRSCMFDVAINPSCGEGKGSPQSAAPQAPAVQRALTQLRSKTSHFSPQLEYSDCNPPISMHFSFKQTPGWKVRNTFQQCVTY